MHPGQDLEQSFFFNFSLGLKEQSIYEYEIIFFINQLMQLLLILIRFLLCQKTYWMELRAILMQTALRES